MTNKGVRRNRSLPFILELILPFGTVDESQVVSSNVHLYHVVPREKKFSEDLLRVSIVGKLENNLRNTLIKSFKRNFPPETWTEITTFNTDSKAEPFDTGIKKNSLALVRIDKVKNPALVKVVSFNEENVLIGILKPERKSSLKWIKEEVQTRWFPRTSLLASGVPAIISEEHYHLIEKPSTTLSKLGV